MEFYEILTFSEFIKFYKFYCKETKLQKYNFIEEIAKLRNVSAHNFCILIILNIIMIFLLSLQNLYKAK